VPIIDINFTPSPTVSKFMQSDAFHRAIMGPIGSGKSVGCCFEILRRCAQVAPWSGGLRKSKWAIIRNTQKELRDTTLATWMKWMHELGVWKESKAVFEMRFGDVHADILFRPLDSPADIGRVLSLELTGAWVNEAREVPVPLLADIKGRLRRYPNPVEVPDTWYGMINDTNPPEFDSPYFKLMEHLPQEEGNPNSIIQVETYAQPSGLSPEAENRENLHPDYYTDLAKGQTSAWVGTYIEGKYSPSQAGKPVYANSFKREKHISPVPLKIDPALPVVVGFDTGLTPALLFQQQKMNGRIHKLREIAAFDMGMKRCIQRYVRPMVRNCFPFNPLIFMGDPAGTRRGDGDESSAVKELKTAFRDEGAVVKTAATNNPLVRIQATEQMFCQYPDGEPLTLIDPSCKRYIRGVQSMYRFPADSKGGFATTPQKTGEPGKFGHLVEAGQYADMFYQSGRYSAADYMRVIADSYGFMHQQAYRPAQKEGY
jgi:hypothetical protein